MSSLPPPTPDHRGTDAASSSNITPCSAEPIDPHVDLLREEDVMYGLKRAARFMLRVLYVILVIAVSLCAPVLPIGFFQKKWRDREIVGQIERKR